MKRYKEFGWGVLAGCLVSLAVVGGGSALLFSKSGLDLFTISQKLDLMYALVEHYYYYDEDLTAVEESIYQGLAWGLDDYYAAYYSAEEMELVDQQNQGEYFGIGVQVLHTPQEDGSYITTVDLVSEGSPAQEAGIRPEDILVQVDGIAIAPDTLNNITGPEGTTINLLVRRPSTEEDLELVVERRQVTDITVSHQLLEHQVGYIQIYRFNEITTPQFIAAMKDLDAQGATSYLFDLRGCPGGLVDETVEILDYLLAENQLILSIKDKHGEMLDTFYSEDGHQVDAPMVVLMDENSASAAEIFASALRDCVASPLVGTTSYGKGIVQGYFSLGDGSGFEMTTSAYFTKDEYVIHGQGLEPDHLVEQTGVPAEFSIRIPLAEDSQLQMALSLLTAAD